MPISVRMASTQVMLRLNEQQKQNLDRIAEHYSLSAQEVLKMLLGREANRLR